MTGYVSPVMPFSAISILSLVPFGYTVDVGAITPRGAVTPVPSPGGDR